MTRPKTYEPEEVARRRLVRFLFRIKILNREEHWEIMMRYRT